MLPTGRAELPPFPTREPKSYGVAVGVSSAYEMRPHADCVGLRKYGGLRYLRRVSYVYFLLYPEMIDRWSR